MSTSNEITDNVSHDIDLSLTDVDRTIFTTVRGAVEFFGLSVAPRVAGGWVRDKILGFPSHDIDIALDTMMGVDFATKVNEYLESRGENTHSVAIVKTNPEQSKHLETATVKIHGHFVDFVNLRTEEYCETSRIPSARFGTPEEDAMRRDFTINSLFYNLMTEKVEDWTRKGIEDLRKGIIRTPLPPTTTFLDDPLRILRAIRFATRLSFTISDEAISAAHGAQVLHALRTKVSKERLGKEIEGFFAAKYPVFEEPRGARPLCDQDAEEAARGARFHAEIAKEAPDLLPPQSEARQVLMFALFLAFARERVYEEKPGRTAPLVRYLIKSSIKLRAKTADRVVAAHRASALFNTVFDTYGLLRSGGASEAGKQAEVRRDLAMAVRDSEDWVAACSTAVLARNQQNDQQAPAKQLQEMIHLVRNLGIDQARDVAPLLNGKELMRELGVGGGPHMTILNDHMLRLQFEFPGITREACIARLRELVDANDITIQPPGKKHASA